jgi:hypothetical protein
VWGKDNDNLLISKLLIWQFYDETIIDRGRVV